MAIEIDKSPRVRGNLTMLDYPSLFLMNPRACGATMVYTPL